MKFAHIADCHLGGWREPKLQQLNLSAFMAAINNCLTEKVEFLLISGDLFNTSLPPIDILKEVVTGLKKIKDNKIRVYAIAGSHDYSPSGKTMLDVLENAGLLINVAKAVPVENKLQLEFTKDEKTGILFAGLPGRKGMLDKSYYAALDRESLKVKGTKIFLFHTAISEYKPKEYENMESMASSFLPEGFDYYAGGHVHEPLIVKQSGWLVMPGPLFPNNFAELEKLVHGSMVICEILESKFVPKLIKIPLVDIYKINMDCNEKSSEHVTGELLAALDETEGKIVLIRLHGTLASGKVTDIDFPSIYKKAQNSFFIMRNTSKLHSKDFEEIKVKIGSVDEVEKRIIEEHDSKTHLFENEKDIVRKLLMILSKEKAEGETKSAYEDRILEEFTNSITF